MSWEHVLLQITDCAQQLSTDLVEEKENCQASPLLYTSRVPTPLEAMLIPLSFPPVCTVATNSLLTVLPLPASLLLGLFLNSDIYQKAVARCSFLRPVVIASISCSDSSS